MYYKDWLKLINTWQKFSDLPANQQGPALVSSLEDKALDAILEIHESDISKENGVVFLIHSLNSLPKKDSTVTKYKALEAFKTFKTFKHVNTSLLLKQILWYRDDNSAYRLLKSVNLSSYQEELVKPLIPD